MAQVTIGKGFDVDYYLDQVGADYYLKAGGEPPGRWVGRAAAGLGLEGQVDPDVMRRLYHEHIGPDGQVLGRAQKSPEYETKRTNKEIEERIAARIADLGGPVFETPEAIRHIRLSERAKARKMVPYIDVTFSSEKSISLGWAAARANAVALIEQAEAEAAKRNDAAGDGAGEQNEAETSPARAEAARWEQLAAQVEQAAVAGSEAMFNYLQDRGGSMLRTGHHGKHSGQWRDATGLIGAAFLQHTSRRGDPQLHVQIPIANLAQRADGADDKWRTLDGAQLWHLRLGAAAHSSLAEAQHLLKLGVPLVKRADGNGYEIGGVSQKTISAFSRRTADIEKKIAEYIAEYEETYGRPPSRASLYRRRKKITTMTRAPKTAHQSGPSKKKRGPSSAEAAAAEDRLAAWVEQAEAGQAQKLTGIWDDIRAYAAEHPEANPSSGPSESEQAEIIRAAIAEVQRKNAAWSKGQLEWEILRQLPVLPADMDQEGFLDELADRALANSTEGVTIVQVGSMPDVVDVSGLGHRQSDGISVFRKPNEKRYSTTAHVDLEQWILERSRRLAGQRVTEAEADAALEGTDLDHDQAAAVRGLLTSGQAVTSLVAPAGTGKSYAMARFSRIWMEQTGCRVIGLTLSENAARVLAGEGMTETWNIAKFFARETPVYAGDVLVIDEASQVSTTDLARIMTAAEENGARVILTGDPRQLPAVEAGGMFGLLAKEDGAYRLEEVRRFKESWEKDASVRMRDGDLSAWAEYGARGRVKEGPADRVREEAVTAYVTDTWLGQEALLLAGTNEAAAELAGMVRERRIESGEVPAEREIVLSDGNDASTGDLIRARLNAKISAGGRALANRDTLRLEGWTGTGDDREAVVVRQLSEAEAADDPATRELDAAVTEAREWVTMLQQARKAPGADIEDLDRQLAEERRRLQDAIDRRRAEGGWSRRFTVPASYLAESSELAYAGNIYTAQGRTVDRAHLVIDDSLSRDMLYVGMTRGREENIAHVITGPPDPKDWTREQRDQWAERAVIEAAELAKAGDMQAVYDRMQRPEPEGMMTRGPWESVIAACMEREDPTPTATETLREAQETPVHSRHLLDLLEAEWEKHVVPEIDAMVRARIGEADYQRYINDPARPAFLQTVRAHEIGGRSAEDLLDAITERDLTGLRSIAAGLKGRADKEPQPELGKTSTWGERIPEEWKTRHPSVAEKAQALDERQRELGERVAEQAPHWALARWGVPPSEAGPLRDDWVKRAAQVESYRELAGITDPSQAIGPAPVRQANVTEAFTNAVHALGLPDEAALAAAMSRGDLEADIRNYERARAAGPADISADLDRNRDTAEYAREQARRAARTGNPEIAASAEALAKEVTEGRESLAVADAAHREWTEAVAPQAQAAERARDELRRRGVLHAETPAADAAAERQGEQAQASEGERTAERMTPEQWAERKAAQTARVEADRQARREQSARQLLDIDPELARSAYPDIDLDRLREEALTPEERFERDLETIRRASEKAAAAHAALEAAAENDRRRGRNRTAGREASYDYGRRPRPPDRSADRDGPSLGR